MPPPECAISVLKISRRAASMSWLFDEYRREARQSKFSPRSLRTARPAPEAIRSSTAAGLPLITASKSGVSPCNAYTSRGAPAASSSFIPSTHP